MGIIALMSPESLMPFDLLATFELYHFAVSNFRFIHETAQSARFGC